ncbi:hypothetical protein [Brachybacterium phenoliresistens]|uniref:hypothetical protein n=1 Tax=Brachybacterium phenoliresistens TaxID=396014 RepID=UPI0031DE86CE
MNSLEFPSAEQVLDRLGDDFITAFIDAVDGARADYRELKAWHPDWAPGYTSRFIANFAHERIWDRLTRQVRGRPGVEIRDEEPIREIRTGTMFVTRVKRHHPGERISTYPTAGALAYWAGRAITLEGLEQHSLAAGYYWDRETREIGDAVLSLREALDRPVWGITLERSASAPTGIAWTPIEPGLPELDLSQFATEDEEEDFA